MRMFEHIQSIGSLVYSYYHRTDGAVLPLAALAFPVVLGMVGLGTDASMWMVNKRSLQTAADAAVMAAGWEMAMDSSDYMNYAALKEAQNNGYDPDNGGVMTLTTVSEDGEGTTLGVTLTQDAETFFSKVIFSGSVQVTAYAESYVSGVSGDFCILALEELDSGSLTTNGSVEVNAPDCGIAVNSADEEAMTMSGNVDVTVSTVRITGDYDLTGSVNLVYDTLTTGVSPLDDPYDDLEIPEYEPCEAGGGGTHINADATLSPGVYCGGISISGTNDVEFEPGVYIIDGGDFDVTGGGSLYGEGVTFILTGSGNSYAGLDISGSKQIEFSAPLEGEEMEGVVFFQDRNAPTGNGYVNKLVGTSDIIVDGTIYFPSQELWFGGDATLMAANATPCTRLIARSVTFAGNPIIGNQCDNTAVRDFGTPSVKLVR